MNTSLDNLTHKMQRAALGKIVDVALSRAEQDHEKTMCQLVDVAKQFYGSGFSDETYENAKKVLTDPDSKWTKLINCVLDQTDPHVARTTALNLGYEAFFRGTKTIRENRVKYQCNIPWLILFDPTSACNMHCVGCWAGEYGHKNNLSFEDMDKIVTQGKELGVYLYMLTGGEPLVRKKDVLKLAEKHNDVQFAIYTNSTLIDEPFCEEVRRLGNIAFMLSIEGTPETNDARRGEGHYAAVMHAMDLLKKYGIIFGTSICYTRQNIDAVTNDAFMRFLCEKGAHFGFYFHYMPVGNEAAPELMPTPEQRKYMIDRIRYLRSSACDIPFYPMDFQNDGEFVGGCIAGGRNYFHINSAGDAEPCVFIHYSNANIHDQSYSGDPAQPAVHGLPQRPALQQESPASLPDAGEPRAAGKDGTRDRCSQHRPAVPGKRRAPVREVQGLRRQLAAHGRRRSGPTTKIRESRYENYKDWKPSQPLD